MPALGPRETEPDAWLRWLTEAYALLRRRPGQTLCWAVALLVLFYLTHRISFGVLRSFVFFFLAMLGLTVFIRLAAAADESKRRRIADLLPENTHCVLALGVAAALFSLQTGLELMLQPLAGSFQTVVQGLGLWSPIGSDGLPAAEPLRMTLVGPILVPGILLGLALLAGLLLLLAFGQWFLLPMMVLHSPPLPPSMVVSAKAYPLNPVPMLGLSGVLVITLGVLFLTVGWLGLVMIPFFGAVMYTSYRDVFLGQGENAAEEFEEDDTVGVPMGNSRSTLEQSPRAHDQAA
ncbi:hypothetical protein J2T57_003198 [Natronocella acetinitrilica]|uniref:Transmembrane protein n=1 Tax=Natronocella acetinitrilica TaxID=414046 RepID=A0AAE3KCS1_9GAMM|nr:hypothetical protein [Natronocella acetinitrilica]MCP1676039.1 hypothetical protein [Natronocella acetinitrilica]